MVESNQNPELSEYPSEYVKRVNLGDGTEVTVRPIRPADARELQEGFQRLSPESIYMRFLRVFRVLDDESAEYFANVDYQNRMAIVAEVMENGDPNLIGVARYNVVSPGMAEASLVVIDEYQKRGIGTLLMKELVKYALDHGVDTFVATVQMNNAKIMSFMGRSGFQTKREMLEPGVWEIKVKLEPIEES